MVDIRRPTLLSRFDMREVMRWNKHTLDNMDALNAALGSYSESVVSKDNALALSATNSYRHVTTLTLEAGTYLISGGVMFSGTPTGTYTEAGWSLTEASPGEVGNASWKQPLVPNAASDCSIQLPAKPLRLTSKATVHLVARAGYTVGAVSVYGRISATRVN